STCLFVIATKEISNLDLGKVATRNLKQVHLNNIPMNITAFNFRFKKLEYDNSYSIAVDVIFPAFKFEVYIKESTIDQLIKNPLVMKYKYITSAASESQLCNVIKCFGF